MAKPVALTGNDMETLVNIAIDTPLAIKGCNYIYAPAGQANEYAALAANPYHGCGCKCCYCYVPGVLKITREEFDAGAVPRADYLGHLTKDAKKYQAAGITEQVFFSFTTDVYNPNDVSLTRPSLQIVQEHGMGICVLTKGGSRALADIDLYRPDRDCFASTLTSLDDAFSKKWERNAALPDDRIATLKAFHDRGIFTWVSLEPTLDVEASLAIVAATHGFVDLYKIGRANYLKELTRTTDWEDYTRRMIELCGKLGVAHYIKRDLQPYLPAGYNNPLRVKQHHGPSEPVVEKISQNTPPTGGELATNVAISPVSQEVFQEIINSEDAKTALAEYEALDVDINERTEQWMTRFADVMVEFEQEILPLLDRMNSLLSYHGLRHTPGLPGWAAWYEKYRRSINLKMTMRTVQRKLARFRGEGPEPDGGKSDGSSAEAEQNETQATPVVLESPRELLSKRLKELHTTLSEKSVKSDTMRLERALELVEDTQLAIDEGLFETSDSSIVNPSEVDSVARAGVSLAKSLLNNLPAHPPKRMTGAVELAKQLSTGSYRDLSEVEKALPAFMLATVPYINCLRGVADYSRYIMPIAMRLQLEHLTEAYKEAISKVIAGPSKELPAALRSFYMDAYRTLEVDGHIGSIGTQVDGMSYTFDVYYIGGEAHLIPGSGGDEEAFAKWKERNASGTTALIEPAPDADAPLPDPLADRDSNTVSGI